MNNAQLETTERKNVRVVPDTPNVKSAKTCKLFNAGVSDFAQIGKSADPTCYASPVSQTTDPAVDAAGLFENQIGEVKMEQPIAVGDTVVWRQGMSSRRKGSGIPIGIANCKVLEMGQLGFPGKAIPAARIKLPWERIKGGPIDEWLSEAGIHEGNDMWVMLADLDRNQ